MLHKDNCMPIREALEFLDLVCLILDILRYVPGFAMIAFIFRDRLTRFLAMLIKKALLMQ